MLFDILLIYSISYIFVFTCTNIAVSVSSNKITTIVVTLLILFLIPFISTFITTDGFDYDAGGTAKIECISDACIPTIYECNDIRCEIDKKNKKVYLNEPNTIPGSLAFYLWSPKGKKYRDLLDEMITTAIKDYKNSSKKICNFDTNILSNFSGNKGSKGLKGLKNKIN